jgi:uncharacterized membrane protein YgdD (TMEM256/DUF423 family)
MMINMTIERIWLALAGLSGAGAVAAEAAGRHLAAADPHRLTLAATGARYGLIHAVALLAVVVLVAQRPQGMQRRWLGLCGWCLAAGLLLFPGGLYLLAMGAPEALARLVPVGGVLFIAGWVALVVAAVVPRPAD